MLELSELPPEIATPECTLDGAPRVEAPIATGPAPLTAEAQRILRALERAGGNKARAAQARGMSRVTLWRRAKELGI